MLDKLYATHQGKLSDKWSIYLPAYQRLINGLHPGPSRILEIGVQNGGSLEILASLLPAATHIVGCDINPACGALQFENDRVKVVVGDANTAEAEAKIVELSPWFDLIIDDGSHHSRDIVRSFARYFPRLKDGGVYVAEDLHCSYWREFEGGLVHPASSVAFFKRLADVINHEHWGIPAARSDLLADFAQLYSAAFDADSLAHIHSVEFVNSMCIISRKNPAANVLGTRVIAGTLATVETAPAGLHGTNNVVPDQRNNPWSSIDSLSLVEPSCIYSNIQTLRAEASARAEEIGVLQTSLAAAELRSQIALADLERAQALALNNKSEISNLKAAEEALQQEIANLKAAEQALRHQFEHVCAELRSVRASPLWKITAPVRSLGRLEYRLGRIGRRLRTVSTHEGSTGKMLRKCWRLLHKSGPKAVRRYLKEAEATASGRSTTVPLPSSDGLIEYSSLDYSEWIRRYDTLTDETRANLRQIAGGFALKPLISVVMPCYNTKPEWLREAIESVRRQIYPRWELCIADDASTDPAVRSILQEYSRDDVRIKVAFRSTNGHISAASNSALALAAGEYVALLDHDDILAEQALFRVVEAINRQPDAGLIYSDEDKITESGQRLDPYFKCDWNYDLFLSQNMICHLGVYRAELLRTIGGFREGLEGSQDYDLALRCIEHLGASQIVHVPYVLYHWRTHPASTALSAEAKPFAYVAAERALNEHLVRKGVAALAERHPEHDGLYRVRYALPEPAPLVTLIIPTRNSLHLIRQCISSILEKTEYPNYEILVVDNGSDDPQTLSYFDSIRHHPRLRILRDDRPFNYSALNNRAAKSARGELLGLINNDIEVKSREWLSEMVSIALQPGVGAVGARLWYPDNTLQHGGVIVGLGGVAGHSHKHLPKGDPGYFFRAMLQQSLSAVTAACMVVRRSIFLELGGLEEESLKVAFNDVDFCLKVREAGYRNVWTPYAELYHHESASRGYEDTPEKQARFGGEVRHMQRRWGSLLLNDPAYSPNLTLDREDFSYAWPPRTL